MCSALLTGCLGGIESVGTTGATPDAATKTPDAAVTPKEDPAKPTVGNFERWMKCMTLSDFRTANMLGAWNNITTTDAPTQCRTCHENGGDGFIVTPVEQKMFDTIKTNKLYALEYFTYSAIETPFTVRENQIAMQGVSTAQDPHREHPRFSAVDGLAASQLFAQLTQARYEATGGNCP